MGPEEGLVRCPRGLTARIATQKIRSTERHTTTAARILVHILRQIMRAMKGSRASVRLFCGRSGYMVCVLNPLDGAMMRLLNLLILTSAALGCHADMAATPQAVAPIQETAVATPGSEEGVEQGAAARPQAPQAMTRPIWRWSHYGPEAIKRGAHEQRSQELGDATISLEVGVKPERIVVKSRVQGGKGLERWSYTLEDALFVTGAALMVTPALRLQGSTPHLGGDGELVVLAVYPRISSGCTLIALDAETGALRWRSALTALGPVDHSKYRNDVQLAMFEGKIVVYGYEASGRYIEIVDPETGRTLHNISPSGGYEWADWGWQQQPEGRERERGRLESRWASSEEGTRGREIKLLRGAGPRWSVVLGARGDERELEVAASEERPFKSSQVAAHADSVAILYTDADGAPGRLVGLDSATGKERWSTPLVGLGASASGLSQRVTPSTGSFVVTSEGAQGASLEIVDKKSGQVIWYERVYP
jgi:hypothetical protein